MSQSLFSESWYRVEFLRPQLKPNTSIHRHRYRGQTWYLLEDQVTGKSHRFSESAYAVISRMNGCRTIKEIWQSIRDAEGEACLPEQDEVIHLLEQLHMANVLQTDAMPNYGEMAKRRSKRRRNKMLAYIMNPMALKIPLFDPDYFLDRILPYFRPLLGWFGFYLWLMIVGSALVFAAENWEGLSRGFSDRVLSGQNLFVLWLVFPLLKIFHEFGHALLVKKWGGEVHAVGIMILVLVPIPYVDASAASVFREKHQRVVVGAAGMMFELFIASFAMFVWMNAEQGLVHAIAYNVMLLAVASTVLFNANPLLRYDGYYILADFLEIPNLASRSNRYVGYLIQKYLLGAKEMHTPASGPGEEGRFLLYAVASFVYRMFIMVVIVLFLASKYFVIGVVLAIWLAIIMFLIPLFKSLRSCYINPMLQRKRARMLTTGVCSLILSGLFFFAIPFPSWTMAEGIVWVPENTWVRSGASGFVDKVYVKDGEFVRAGKPLVSLNNPEFVAHLKVLQAEMEVRKAEYGHYLIDDRVKLEQTRKKIEQLHSQITTIKERIANLVIRSPGDGVVSFAWDAQDLPGRYVKRGELLGYVPSGNPSVVRVVVPQADISAILNKTKSVKVRLVHHLHDELVARIVRETPAASTKLPSMALSDQGGGDIPLDPRSEKDPKTLSKVFQFDLQLPETGKRWIGERVYVRFNHPYEYLGSRLNRKVRQVFLKRLHV